MDNRREDITSKLIVLVLNKNWHRIGYTTVGDAITSLCGGENYLALDIDYNTDENGNPYGDPISINPVNWDNWITLPIKSWDLTISSTKLKIRVPTIIIAKNYSKIPYKRFRHVPTTEDVYIRDKGIDQYTGKKIDKKNSSIDHIIPKSKGGQHIWTNVVLTSKENNCKKGSKLLNEIGLKPINTPIKPQDIPVSELIKEAKHFTWIPFLN